MEVIPMATKSARPEDTINGTTWAILKQMIPSNIAVTIAVLTHPFDLIRLMREGAALKKQAGSTIRKEHQLPYVIPPYREGMRHSK